MTPVLGSVFPPELSALRIAGLVLGIILIGYALLRRRTLSNAVVVFLVACGLGLLVVAGTELTDWLLSAFSFERGNGGRILGLAVFAIVILFVVSVRALSIGTRNRRELSEALEIASQSAQRLVQPPARGSPRRPLAFFVGAPKKNRDHGLSPCDRGLQGGVIGKSQILPEPEKRRGHGHFTFSSVCSAWVAINSATASMATARGELLRQIAPMRRVGSGLAKGLKTRPRGAA